MARPTDRQTNERLLGIAVVETLVRAFVYLFNHLLMIDSTTTSAPSSMI